MKILLVEDDESVASVVSEALSNLRFIVNTATDGQSGLELAQSFEYDLIILDVIVPKLDGISLCRRLRSSGYETPILLLTAKDQSNDKVMGLEAGADDYVVKPFELSELIARIRALLRRRGALLPSILTWENLRLDPSSSDVTYAGQLLSRLTPKEYSILELFLRNPQRVFSRSEMLDRLWDFAESPGEGTITTHIKSLRHKLKSAGAPGDFIETLHGLGYRLKSFSSEKNSAKSTPSKLSQKSNQGSLEQAQQQVLASLAGIWERSQDSVYEQVALLEQAAAASIIGKLSVELRHKAKQEAHKLIGGLGIFGFSEASKLARQIEHLLLPEVVLGEVEGLQLQELVMALKEELKQPTVKGKATVNSADKTPSTQVLLIDDDLVLAQQLKAEAMGWSIEVDVATDLAQARKALAKTTPQIVLLDLSFSDSAESGLTMLAELNRTNPTIPVIVFTSQESLIERVEVARQGARAFLQKPVTANEVLETVTQVLDQADSDVLKIVIVDDDPGAISALCPLLEPWGLDIVTLTNPQKFLDVFSVSPPDLLVLDLEMPGFSGLDLCRVVRNDPHWGDIPIVFLTEQIDTDTIHQIFAAGADDYIRKPAIAPELVTRIIGRLERTRLRRQRANYSPKSRMGS